MPGQVQGQMDSAYVSNINFLHMRDIYYKIYNRYHENTIMDFFEQTGREVLTNNTFFNWHEKDWIYNTAILESFTGGASAGAAAVITLADASHQNSGTKSPFNPNDLLMIGLTRLFVQSKDEGTPNAHTITVVPVNDAIQLDAVIAALDTIVNYSNANAEGTGQPNSNISSPLTFSNNTQIFKTKFEVTGTEATNKLEVAVTNSDKYYYMYEGADDAFIKHKLDVEYGLLLGQKDSGLLDAAGNEVLTTKGMDQFITEDGNTQPYVGSFDQMSYIDEMVKTLSVNRAPKENMLLAGVDLNLDIDNLITDVMKAGGIQYNQFGRGNAQQKSVDLGFDSFVKGSFIFHKKEFEALNHQKITSAPGQTWPGVGYVIPLEKVRDPKTSKNLDTIACRYKANDKETRKYKHWVRDISITNDDKLEFNYMCDKGLHLATVNRFIKIDQA